MSKIYITDLIGSYTGADYYDISFGETLEREGFEVDYLSTFNTNNRKIFFPIIFRKNKIINTILLLYSFVKFVLHQIRNRDCTYIYMCYGEFYDILMLLTNIWSDRLICDIHEVHALKYKDDSKVAKFFKWYYKHNLKRHIYHSGRSKKILDEIGIESERFYLPHFEYKLPKEYDEKNIANEIKDVFNTNNTKFLFFGNLSTVKGIDTTIKVFESLSEEEKEKVELVIAGRNVDNINFENLKKTSPNYKVIERRINDDELIYLYSNTDYILLPYEKSSQSGIFAMAEHFQKPMLLSNIDYFKNMISEFPSFGLISPKDQFDKLVKNVISNNIDKNFYKEEDLKKSNATQWVKEFVKQLK